MNRSPPTYQGFLQTSYRAPPTHLPNPSLYDPQFMLGCSPLTPYCTSPQGQGQFQEGSFISGDEPHAIYDFYNGSPYNPALYGDYPILQPTSQVPPPSVNSLPPRPANHSSPSPFPPSPGPSISPQLPHEQLGFIHRSFPLNTPEHGRMRDLLLGVLNSLWLHAHEFEPKNSGILQGFIDHNKSADRWECCFWENNRRCRKAYRKKDQAVSHIRVHIKHYPYACSELGPCPVNGPDCTKRYPSVESLQKHRAPPTQCHQCHKPMLKGNLRRHLSGPCRGQTSPGSSPSIASSPEGQ